MQAIVRRLGFAFDRIANALIFNGELESGYRFEVVFPIGHVALTFDREARGMGYCGEPIMGAIDTVDSFLGAVEIMHERETGVAMSQVDVFEDGVELGNWIDDIRGKVRSIMALQQKEKRPVTDAELRSMGLSRGGSLVSDIGKTAGGVLKTAGSVTSYVPGVGTAVGAGLKTVGGIAQGQNVLKAAQSAATTAVPYAQLAVQGINLASDVARGKNVLKSVANRAIDTAISVAPGGDTARAALNVARQGLQGKNVLKAAAGQGLAIVPGVSSVASKAYSAALKTVGQQAVKFAGKAVTAVGQASAATARAGLVAQALSGSGKAVPAVGSQALAAWSAANKAATLYNGARRGVVSPLRVVALQRNVQSVARSNQPIARMALAGLKSVRV